jgi:hypothetical protein
MTPSLLFPQETKEVKAGFSELIKVTDHPGFFSASLIDLLIARSRIQTEEVVSRGWSHPIPLTKPRDGFELVPTSQQPAASQSKISRDLSSRCEQREIRSGGVR